MEMEINNGEVKECQWAPIETDSFGSVSNLRFHFNGSVSWKQRVAVVKFYFQLGLEAGLYSNDTGFQITEGWRKQLHRGEKGDEGPEIQTVKATTPDHTVGIEDPPTPQRAHP
jgi:hypothetical protein